MALMLGQFCHLFISWLLVCHWQLDIVGTGLASAFTNGLVLVISLIYSCCLTDITDAIRTQASS